MRNQGHLNIPISRFLISLLLFVLSACGKAIPMEEVPTQEPTVVPFDEEPDPEPLTPTPLAVTSPTEEATHFPATAVPVATTNKIQEVSPEPTVVADNPTAPATTTATESYPPPLPPSHSEPYTIVSVSNDDVLNVRAYVGIENPIVGTIPPAAMNVQLLGEGQVADDGAQWLPIQYQELRGWVNSTYLARQVGTVEVDVALKANEVILALPEGNLEQLAKQVHPDKGVRFSPYTYVSVNPASPENQDLVFSASQISTLFADPTIYYWGSFDGTGEPIDMTFKEYFGRFIYDVDFARPHVVGYNEFVGQESMINNIREVYPNGIVVEYHFDGFEPQYGGLDWRSLRLVLEKQEGVWYLVGIVHSEWTT